MLIRILMSALVVMNHAAASGTTSSPEVSSSTCVMANSQTPASNETVQLTDRSTIYRSHDYEELPTSSYENPDYGYYSTRGEECAMLASSADSHSPAGESNVVTTPGSSLHSSLMTSGDDQSTLLGRRSCPGFRKRVNPLYCTLPTAPQSKKSGHCSPSLALCLATCVSVAAILIAILSCVMVIMSVHDSRSAPETALLRLKTLEQRYNLLITVLNGTGSMEDGSDVQFVKNRMFAGLRSEFRDDMRQLRDELFDEISNTSTHLSVAIGSVMSHCEHKLVTHGLPADIAAASTKWVPDSMQDANNWFITGITCTTDGGTSAFLETRSFPNGNATQYKCKCHGKSHPAFQHRFCFLHYWRCPVRP